MPFDLYLHLVLPSMFQLPCHEHLVPSLPQTSDLSLDPSVHVVKTTGL